MSRKHCLALLCLLIVPAIVWPKEEILPTKKGKARDTKAVEIERATGSARERLLTHKAARLAAKQAELGKLSREFGDALEKAREGESMSPP